MKNGLEVDNSGNKRWYKNNLLHREDGPAVEHTNGDKYWFINGKQHREDGPAIEYAVGNKYWYINDKHISSQEEFEKLIKLKAFW